MRCVGKGGGSVRGRNRGSRLRGRGLGRCLTRTRARARSSVWLEAPGLSQLKHGEEELPLIHVRAALGVHSPVGLDGAPNTVVARAQRRRSDGDAVRRSVVQRQQRVIKQHVEALVLSARHELVRDRRRSRSRCRCGCGCGVGIRCSSCLGGRDGVLGWGRGRGLGVCGHIEDAKPDGANQRLQRLPSHHLLAS